MGVERSITDHRIIPAYAGNACRGGAILSQHPDHPRVCGERGDVHRGHGCVRGSSPRMRGTRRRVPSSTHGIRIIPAYAGNAAAMATNVPLPTDHPRVCGERQAFAQLTKLLGGSSPRMRGTRTSSATPTPACRIIPAYAGNASSSRMSCTTSTDHPRVCGERPGDFASTNPRRGSSPRMRGTHRTRRFGAGAGRIIPA